MGKYIPQLDGVRAVAIALVLLTHLWGGGYSPGHWFNDFAALGWVGVDLFFVMSGFLITGILRNARDDPHHFRNFYARRALRIFPLYYLLLTLVLMVLPLVKKVPAEVLEDRWFYWLYMGNVALADGWHQPAGDGRVPGADRGHATGPHRPVGAAWMSVAAHGASRRLIRRRRAACDPDARGLAPAPSQMVRGAVGAGAGP